MKYSIDDLRAFVVRAPKTAEQWLKDLGAIPCVVSAPTPPSPIEISSDEASSSDSGRDDLVSPIRKRHIGIPPPDTPTHLAIDSRNSGNTVTSNNVKVGEIRGEKLGGPNFSQLVANGSSSINPKPEKTVDSDDDEDDDADDSFRARWGVAHTPLTSTSIQRMFNPTPAGAKEDAFIDRFFTPGKGPTYFKLQIATTEFCVNIKKTTTLTELLGIVQRDFLDKVGWPAPLGLTGPDGVMWDEEKWEMVKLDGKLSNVIVLAELVYDV